MKMLSLSSFHFKKVIMVLLTITLSVSTVSLFSLRSAKADTITPATTTSYGSYYVETYFRENNNSVATGWVVDLGLIQINMSTANSSVYHFHYDFSHQYEGYLNITVTSASNWVLNDCELGVQGGWFMSIPNKTTSSTSKTFRIGMSGTQQLDFYLVHKATSISGVIFNRSVSYTISYSLESGLTDNELLDHIDTMLMTNATYQIDVESIPAWAFFQPGYDHVSYGFGDIYPHIIFASGYQSKTFRLEPDEEVVLYAYMSTDLACSMYQNRFTLTTSRLEQYKISGMSLYIITMKNNTNASTTDRLQLDYSGTCIPIYYGYEENMPDNLCNMFGIETKTESLLKQILQALQSGGTSVPVAWLDTWNNVLTSVSTFITQITTGYGLGGTSSAVSQDFQITSNQMDYNGWHDGSWGYGMYLAESIYTNTIGVFPTFRYLVVIGFTVIILRLFL